jgi:hypothetical protein
MTLETYYLLSLSIAATLTSILVIVLIVMSVWFSMRLRQLLDKIDAITATTVAMGQDVRELVHTTTDRLLAFEKTFLTVQGVKQVAQEIADAVKSRVHRAKDGSAEE